MVFFCGYLGAQASKFPFSAQESLPIVLADLTCTGTESSLLDCGHNGIGHHDCTHNDDAAVRCQGSIICINMCLYIP